MYKIRILLVLTLSFFTAPSFANTGNVEPLVSNSNEGIIDNLLGYEYNLWGIKAENKNGSLEYEYTGRIFLDKRKGYKVTYEEDEHFFFFKEKFSNGEVFEIPGSNEGTEFVNRASIDEYYIALKFGPQWKHHQLREILQNVDSKIGTEVGCENCNFAKSYYDLEKDWALTVYYEIKPIFKDTGLSNSEMARQVLEALDAKEGFGETQEVITEVEVAVPTETVKIKRSPVVAEVIHQNKIVETKSVITKPVLVEKPSPVLTAPQTVVSEIVNQNVNSYHVLFRVLNDSNQTFDDLTHLGPLYKETFDANGSTRYLIGNSATIQDVKILEQKVKEAGYNSTIIAAYKNGELKDYIDSNVETSNYPRKTYTNTYAEIQDYSGKSFGSPIQFTAISNASKSFSQLAHLGEVTAEKVEGQKLFRYQLKPFEELDINAVVDEIKGFGFTGAFIVN